MENVQKTRRLFASAYGCKASRSFLIWSLSAAMSISVAPMMAEVSADVRNFGTQLVTQVKRVTGTIIDETGEPMIWSISLGSRERTTGTVTDLDGKFVLEIPANATLVISYIGYKTQNIKVGSQHAFAIKMESDNEVLDEVVVIGYQTIKRKDLTGSVASVSGKTVSVMPVSNVAQAMQGLRQFMFQNVYTNPVAKGEETKAKELLERLFVYYLKHIDLLPGYYLQMLEDGEENDRVVCDYIAGMTDQYALAKYSEYFMPKSWQVY